MPEINLDLMGITEPRLLDTSRTLARAFQFEPKICQYIPDPEERKLKTPFLFEFIVRYGIKFGEVYADSNDIRGAAVWLPPDQVKISRDKARECGSHEMSCRLGQETLDRQRLLNEHAAEIHHRQASFPHWYLWVLGVRPEFAGQGWGGRLLKPMLSRIDEEKMPCFLETHTEENVALYRHFGFEVVEEAVLRGSDLKHWAMIRDKAS